jgi:hypothetical protein
MINDNDIPDFPTSNEDVNNKNSLAFLTKREYFAAMAMQGIMANSDFAPVKDFEGAATRAVEMSDALLAALEKQQP